MKCPLCLGAEVNLYDQDKNRSYYECSFCQLIFVPRHSLLSLEDEKKRYDLHQNESNNHQYTAYLSELASRITPHLRLEDKGLDFGSGATRILENALLPFQVNSYDLFYYPNPKLLEEFYDFIILSEVIEHLRGPREIMLGLKKILRPQGKLFLKTKMSPNNKKQFSDWFYKRDMTHIQFFNQNSFEEIKRLLNFSKVEEIGQDLFLFTQ